MPVNLTHDFSTKTDQPVVGSEVQDNFSDLASAIENRAPIRGITSEMLTDRYAIECWGPMQLIAYEGSGDYATPAQVTAPAGLTTVARFTARVPPGRRCFLCIVAVRAGAVTLTGGNPTFQVRVGGATVGGASVELTNTNERTLERSDPFDNHLLEIADGDTIEMLLGSSGGSPTLSDLVVTFWVKQEFYR